MGLFKSDEAQFPEPRVTLQFDPACKPPFHPGANVFGQIFFDSPIERQIRNIQVLIEGTTTTKYVQIVGGGEHQRVKIFYSDIADLRRMSQVVVEALSLEPNHRYTWDFSLAFPHGHAALLHPNPAKSPYTGSTGHRNFYAPRPYQLPPSFLHWESDDHLAQVQYAMKLVITFNDQKEAYSPPIKILAYLPSQEPQEQKLVESVFHINSYSSSRLAGSSKSGLSRLKDRISSNAPSVKLSFRSSMPSSVVRGAAFPVNTQLEVRPLSNPSLLKIPSVQIKITSIELVPTVIYRTLKDEARNERHPLQSMQCPSEQELVEEGKAVLLNAVPQEINSNPQRMEKSDAVYFPAVFEGRIPGNVSPSFATSNIVLWWKLRVKVVANVCGKEIEDAAETKVMVGSDVST